MQVMFIMVVIAITAVIAMLSVIAIMDLMVTMDLMTLMREIAYLYMSFVILYFGTSGGVAVEQAIRRSTGNDVSEPLFSSLFSIFHFCQAQPKPQLQLSWGLSLHYSQCDPATHPAGHPQE